MDTIEMKIIHTFRNKKTGEAGGVITVHAPKGVSIVVGDDCWVDSGSSLSIIVPNSVVSFKLSDVHIYGKSALNITIGNECSDFRLKDITLQDESVLDIEVEESCGSIRISDYYSNASEIWARTIDCCSIDLEDISLVEQSVARLRAMGNIIVKGLKMIEASCLEVGFLTKSQKTLMYRPDNLIIEEVDMEDETLMSIGVDITEMKDCEESSSDLIFKDIKLTGEVEIRRTLERIDSAIFDYDWVDENSRL